MRKYVKYLELGFQDALYYRTSNILTFLSSFLIDYVKVMVWYGAISFAERRMNGSIVNYTVTYMIMVCAISSIYRTDPKTTLSRTYVEGTLIHRFIYPVSILISNFFEMLGRAASRFCINVLPTLLILSWILKPNWELEWSRLPFVILNLLIGLYMNYLLFSAVDVLCFWVKDASILQKVREFVFKFFSGSLFPLWFMTNTFALLSAYLPFEKQIYTPVIYLLGMTIDSAFFKDLGVLIIYCIGFTLLVGILWKKGIKRIESFGG